MTSSNRFCPIAPQTRVIGMERASLWRRWRDEAFLLLFSFTFNLSFHFSILIFHHFNLIVYC